jgi:hypothetical protein
MPSNKAHITATAGPVYTIWFSEKTRQGTAEELLDTIRGEAAQHSPEFRKLTNEKYADILISDADFFLPRGLLEFLRMQSFESKFDRALRYLSEMPASGLRILKKEL